jgi:Uncharacterized protein conserved in bacteria (DUF2188)
MVRPSGKWSDGRAFSLSARGHEQVFVPPKDNSGSMSTPNRRTVAPHNGRWAVEKPGTSRVSSVHNTQREAQRVARGSLTRTGGGELVTMGNDCRIRAKDTVAPGRDPFPPRG